MPNHAPRPILNLSSLLDQLVDARTKGFPRNSEPLSLKDIGSQQWNMLRGDLSLPVALIRQTALQQNIAWMRRYAELRDVQICPHGKTTMSPQLFDLQLQAGAWGLTAATTTHVEVYLKHGVRRIIFANQLVAESDMDFVISRLQAYPDLDFYCLVDSVSNVEKLAQRVAAKGLDRPLQLLLETGIPGGRCGVRTQQQAMALAQAIKARSPHLALRGIEAFEGIVDLFSQAGRDKIQDLLERALGTALACQQQGLFAPGKVYLTAGGSACFDDVVTAFKAHALKGDVEVVIRSGCYVVHDHGFYARLTSKLAETFSADAVLARGLQPALEVWAWVQSLPEPGLAIVSLGKRDAGSDISLPELQWHFRPGQDSQPQPPSAGFQTLSMNDQHLYLKLPENAGVSVGDMLGFGISHPCTTFDKWQLLYCVDDEYTVLSAIKTCF